jgi:hypothetical protein
MHGAQLVRLGTGVVDPTGALTMDFRFVPLAPTSTLNA